MAIIIDGWDKLPQNCYGCDLHNYHECDLTSNSIEDYYNGETREPGCPLKEVSENSVLEDIKVEMENLKDNRCFCHHYERGINECINVLNKHMESEYKE